MLLSGGDLSLLTESPAGREEHDERHERRGHCHPATSLGQAGNSPRPGRSVRRDDRRCGVTYGGDARFPWDQRLGGILADDMGLEKTLQTLTMAERDRNNGTPSLAAPVLVVAPTSVVATWARESRRMSDLQER